MLKFDPMLLTLLLGVILPIVRGIITKVSASQSLKTTVGLILSTVAGIAVQAQQGDGLISKQMVVAAIIVFVTAQAAHYGVWQPTGASGAIDDKTGNFGIGDM